MPDPSFPRIDSWTGELKKLATNLDENTYFVGHSIGCQTILRFLESSNVKVGGVVLVAPWMTLTSQAIDKPESSEIAKPWLNTPLDFNKVKNKAKKFITIFSDNDPYVPLVENRKIFEEKFNAQIIIEHQKGHLSGDDGVYEL